MECHSLGSNKAWPTVIMHQSFVSTAPPPPPTGMGKDSDFSLFRALVSPALWGQADGNIPTLSPALHYRKSHQGKCPNVLTPALPWYCGDNQKVLALHYSTAIPPLSGRWGGGWIQMTGTLTVINSLHVWWVNLHFSCLLIFFKLNFFILSEAIMTHYGWCIICLLGSMVDTYWSRLCQRKGGISVRASHFGFPINTFWRDPSI